ncbi:hypothetical protein J3E72DRAFT_34425 [Bipolaris maydis]|nr:hypothetical protein J3E73DRAFT_422002 [Bipolaris maydis]KAJ5042557.1 hypothetical protein J3E74DRAFT_479290 [Bipolaris maydis]KAJ5063581.1 hypothetical protein J3E74DRAFT_472513 [Bipolaris maydis]KAJ6199838.1 hypothetical protein J3E72DRAFT_34425 [Bipolaris maydis]KAJ6205552.1 hypothetical protein PSV09DRAFT_2384715 [Bipolaris maydis]
MTQALSKQNNQNQVQQRHQDSATQVHERTASANASAGLNLNLFAALSGAFSSKSKKSTRQEANGDTVTEEERWDRGEASGVARAQGHACAAANAEEREVKAKRVDHLGIEG